MDRPALPVHGQGRRPTRDRHDQAGRRRRRRTGGGVVGALDHGRGRWPYNVRWNWGAGSGRTDGRVVGIQVGGQWTDGTGSVENSLYVDGHLTKISEELVWDYDREDWLAPWRITGSSVDLTFVPFHLKRSVTDLKVFASRTHQCFGHWSGRVRDDTGTWVRVEDVVGWAEDVHNRW
nr:DUF2804 domain-containing protein [Nocardioides sp. IC4_145]